MGSAFSVGGLLGNVIWGTFSDRFGRRPALLAGLFGTALSSLCFGFSPNFWFAVAARFMWGILNGNIGVAKTYLAEVCDDTNSAKGMALFGVIGGVGRTIGPVVGGFLSSPAENYPNLDSPSDSLALLSDSQHDSSSSTGSSPTKHGVPLSFSLPAVVSGGGRSNKSKGLYSKLTTIEEQGDEESIKSLTFSNVVQVRVIGSGSLAFSPLKQISRDESPVRGLFPPSRSSPRVSSSSSSPPKDNKIIAARASTPRLTNTHNSSNVGIGDSSSRVVVDIESGLSVVDESSASNSPTLSDDNLVTDGGGDECDSAKLLGGERRSKGVEEGDAEEYDGSEADDSGHVRYSNGSEFNESYLNSLKSISSNLVYLLTRREILVTTTMYGFCALGLIMWNEVFPLWVVTAKDRGGFEYTSHTIGIATMITGVISILTQVFIYPALVQRMGVMNVYRLGVFFMGTSCVVMPMVSLLVKVNEMFAFVMVVVVSTIANLTAAWAMICIFVLINNSCYSHQRATVNGIGQTFASLGRVTGPYLGGMTFAWSETNGKGWPVNYYLDGKESLNSRLIAGGRGLKVVPVKLTTPVLIA
eukprot:gene24616-30984_t